MSGNDMVWERLEGSKRIPRSQCWRKQQRKTSFQHWNKTTHNMDPGVWQPHTMECPQTGWTNSLEDSTHRGLLSSLAKKYEMHGIKQAILRCYTFSFRKSPDESVSAGRGREASTLQCLQVAWWGTCSRCTYLQKEVLRMPRSVVLPDSHRMVHLLAHWVPQMRVTRKSPRGLLVQRTNVNEETKHFQRELFKEGVQLPMCKGWGGARLVPQTSQLCPERVGKSKPATRTEMLLKACVDGSYQLDTLHLHFIGFNGSFWPILHCKKF